VTTPATVTAGGTVPPGETPSQSPTVTSTPVNDRFVALPQPLAMPYNAIRGYYEGLKGLVDGIWKNGLLRPAEGSAHPVSS